MGTSLQGKRVAILAADGFEEAELFTPRDELIKAGATVEIVSPQTGEIQGFNHLSPGRAAKVDRALKEARPKDYDALMLPGGANNPDQLRINEDALAFVRGFIDEAKPAGVICHAPWILIYAGVAKGRTLTSYKTIRTDLRNAGANVVDREVVVDRGLVTSRDPSDLPAFCAKLIEEIAEGPGQRPSDAAGAALH